MELRAEDDFQNMEKNTLTVSFQNPYAGLSRYQLLRGISLTLN